MQLDANGRGGTTHDTAGDATRPVILVVDDDRGTRAPITTALERRYGADYDVRSVSGPTAAIAELRRLHERGDPVALVVAHQSMDPEPGTAFLSRARDVYPTARRLLISAWPGLSSLHEVAKASTLGEIDHHIALPDGLVDERFLSLVAEVIADWAREQGRQTIGLRIVAEPGDPDAVELVDVFEGWVGELPDLLEPGSPEGARLVAAHGAHGRLPLVIVPDGRALTRPSVADVIRALGEAAVPSGATPDVAVLGGGPAGLSAALNAASEGMSVVLLEPSVGQASASPMIRNYLGFPGGISGGELVRRAWWQASMLGVHTLGGRSACGLRADGAERIVVLDDGSEVRARAVVLAMGVAYRRIGVPSVEALVGRGVFYGSGAAEASALAGEPVAVVGGGNSAAESAVHLARYASRVHMLVRGASLSESVSGYLIQQLEALDNVEVHLGTEVVEAREAHRLRSLSLRDKATGDVTELAVTALFLLIGAEPRTDWLPEAIARDERGFVVAGDPLSTGGGGDGRLPLETSMPGVFAVGDVRKGSVKRVAPAVGDGAAVSQQLMRYLAEHPAREPQPTARS